ncbi:YbjQ family protein [bacterium]|nr:YbjQ family protein [bacterium]
MAEDIIVTTGDLNKDYEIIGPVYFQISNKGIFSNALSKLVKKYEAEIAQMKKQGIIEPDRPDWGFLYGEWSVGQSDFEKAFFVAVQELKKRASLIGADAIIGMRQDIDLDTTTFQFFYLQMYGTAVRIR